MTMILDIGNTNVDFLYNNNIFSINTIEFCADISVFFTKYSVEMVVFVSVVPELSLKVKEEARKNNIICREVDIGDIPMEIQIDNIEELGIDRVINAYCAMCKFQQNLVVVDFGTALTFDIIYNKAYVGGMIFPGLTMAMHNLHTKTAKLPDVKIEKFRVGIGKNTVDAISFGVCVGYCGVLKETLSYIEGFYNKQFKVIFTGGSGKLFNNFIDGAIFEESLILDFLKGLK
ncbi:MAG: type III pantothenate kinase [Candidatus Deianiraeaceae bacterium]|jgi:type III pantothenate kinase